MHCSRAGPLSAGSRCKSALLSPKEALATGSKPENACKCRRDWILLTAHMIIITRGSDKVGTLSPIMVRDITTGQKGDAVTVQHWEELITALKPYASTGNTL